MPFAGAAAGPVVALTNEHAGSDGDIFSHGFKLMGIGALVGMAALFAGASRAPLTAVVFAFEATRHPRQRLLIVARADVEIDAPLLCHRRALQADVDQTEGRAEQQDKQFCGHAPV